MKPKFFWLLWKALEGFVWVFEKLDTWWDNAAQWAYDRYEESN